MAIESILNKTSNTSYNYVTSTTIITSIVQFKLNFLLIRRFSIMTMGSVIRDWIS